MTENFIEFIIHEERYLNSDNESSCLSSSLLSLQQVPLKGEYVHIAGKSFIVNHRILILKNPVICDNFEIKWKIILHALNGRNLSEEDKKFFKSFGWIERDEQYAYK